MTDYLLFIYCPIFLLSPKIYEHFLNVANLAGNYICLFVTTQPLKIWQVSFREFCQFCVEKVIRGPL